MKLSARNVLEGKVVSIKEGPVSTEVTIELACGTGLSPLSLLLLLSLLTLKSAKSLRRNQGFQRYGRHRRVINSHLRELIGAKAHQPPSGGFIFSERPLVGDKFKSHRKRL